MPGLKKLSIKGLRNLEAITLTPSPGFNLFHGSNGSGKTSLLEAVFLLGRARTFRSNTKSPLIQHGADETVIFGELDDGDSLGYRCTARAAQEIRINGKDSHGRAVLAQHMPLQLFNADAFKILEGSPAVRRSFLDWGVFHVEHGFIEAWRHGQKALASRNALLKSKSIQQKDLAAWTHEFARHAEKIDSYRQRYIEKLDIYLQQSLARLLPLGAFRIEYERGWDTALSLEEALGRRLDRDMRFGHTGAGPHRAELRIDLSGKPAAELLSRGQQKLLVIAMKLAQAMLLKEQRQMSCIFLMDDLPAELDSENRARVMALLGALEEQVFVTGIEHEPLLRALPEGKEIQLFHVKHGKINAD